MTVPFDRAEVEAGIGGTEFAGYLRHLTTVDSTQDLAHAAAQAGARHGVWIADEQTAGRGRGDHRWHSAPGDGLYLTALSTPPIPMQSTLGFSFHTAIAVQAAIAETTGLVAPREIDIRWPNDLVIAQPVAPSRKVGGILIEAASHPATATNQPAMLRHVVIGIGINLNHIAFPPELDGIATSLRRELPGQPVLRREPLAAAILRNLDEEIRLMIGGWRGTNNRRDRDPTLYSTWIRGKRVRVEPRPGDTSETALPGYTGVTAGFNPQGFLLVQGDDGQLHTVFSGGLREI
jgi:BirA family biotin operon repressor/biotin-[acetyl-CoA-carboxylase] ligase